MGRRWGHGPHSFLSPVPEPSHLTLPASGRFPVLVRQGPLLAQFPSDSGVFCCGVICGALSSSSTTAAPREAPVCWVGSFCERQAALTSLSQAVKGPEVMGPEVMGSGKRGQEIIPGGLLTSHQGIQGTGSSPSRVSLFPSSRFGV